ncbi:hypothetical protein T02_10176 [Trichinella nativa]|uniref:Uncharacterized protein n=1 Tax=Trichinella nativa TaxID=6335 RepID=A0A0V1KKC3_9BILA|nr:hypothetical protein T02_10176 [Trichinella nativa]
MLLLDASSSITRTVHPQLPYSPFSDGQVLMYVNVPVTCLICSQQRLFRTERQRPRRRDPAHA